jgi:hypothetical protein
VDAESPAVYLPSASLPVAQVSKPAVSQASKPAGLPITWGGQEIQKTGELVVLPALNARPICRFKQIPLPRAARTFWIAGFQFGRAQAVGRTAGLETGDTAVLETCATLSGGNDRSPLRAIAFVVALIFLGCQRLFAADAAPPPAPDYSAVDTIFSKYCLDCHASQDPEAKLVLEGFDTLMKGSENGPVLTPGKGAESLLIRVLEGKAEKDGKQIIMPPKKRKKLEPAEIALIKAWIDAGAQGPTNAASTAAVRELQVPKIALKGEPRNPINVLIRVPGSDLVAVGRYGKVELRSITNGAVLRTAAGHHGNVNALASSADGARLFAGAGEDVLFGEIKEWNIADGALVRTFVGHKDAVYSLAISPDGGVLASGSYDHKIKLWDISTGKELKTLSGHNGCVFGLAFRPDGKILASASADHTVKLWDVASGERRDTLSQPLKDVYAVAFAPDGKRLMAAGVDNRIRVWQISEGAGETTNPLLDAKFAHEGAILRLAFSSDGKLLVSAADDRTVRIWNADDMTERLLLEKQPDRVTGLDFVLDGKEVAAGRMDGSLDFYDLT